MPIPPRQPIHEPLREPIREPSRDSIAQPSAGAGERLLTARLVALFAAGCVLFGYPILGLFARSMTAFGVPLLFVYLFGAWAGFIALLAWLVEGRDRRQ